MAISHDNGFAELAADLERMASKAMDEGVKKKALKAGATPIVARAKATMRRYKKTGALVEGITDEYNSKSGNQDIGYGKKGFYGKFYETGYRPVTGNWRKSKGGRKKLVNKRPSGKFIRREHIKPAFKAEKERVFKEMIEVLDKEFGG